MAREFCLHMGNKKIKKALMRGCKARPNVIMRQSIPRKGPTTESILYKDTHVYMFDSYLVEHCFPERLVTKYSSGKQAHVRRPKKLEAESRDSQSTKEHALNGLIHYFSVRVEEKRTRFF